MSEVIDITGQCPACGLSGLHFCTGRRSGGYRCAGPWSVGGLRKIRDIESVERCRHPEHNPPMHMVYENGVYEYTCPGCGTVTTFRVEKPTL